MVMMKFPKTSDWNELIFASLSNSRPFISFRPGWPLPYVYIQVCYMLEFILTWSLIKVKKMLNYNVNIHDFTTLLSGKLPRTQVQVGHIALAFCAAILLIAAMLIAASTKWLISFC